MKIKHFLMMLLCTAGVTFMTASCEDLFPLDNEEDNTEENNGGDEGDNGNNQSGNEEEDKLLSLSKQMFDAIPAGIYTIQYDGEDQIGVIAKGTDGSGFGISDVNDYFCYYPTMHITENALPAHFHGFDADRTAYSFVYGQPMAHENHVAQWQGITWNSEMIYKLVDEYPTRDDMISKSGEMLAIGLAYKDANPKKIEDAGNFQETYLKLANRYQKFSHKVGPDKMMPQMTVWNPKQWRSDLYPDEMNQKKHIIPYTGGGSFEWMTVNRWMPTGSSLPRLNYPCYVDFVEYIEACYFNVSEADARAYIKKVKEEAPVKNIRHDDDTTGPDENGNTIIMIHFQSDGSPETGDLGYTYCFPGYEVIYFKDSSMSSLTIKFTTNYLTIV